jgi:hypothetical protein
MPTRRWLLLVPIAVAASSAAVTITPVGDVVRNRDAYANTVVTVAGTVTTLSVGYLSDAAYTIQGSDDARITIFGRAPVPAAGTSVVVTGKVGRKPPDEEFDFPPVIIESSRQVP